MRVHVYENPNTSEVSEEYRSLIDALDAANTRCVAKAAPGSVLMSSGEVLGVYANDGRLYLTMKGQYAQEEESADRGYHS